jgi:colanic acid biosynthesis glycosyl transferase WcaI
MHGWRRAPMADEITLVTQHYRPEPIGSGPFCGDIAEFMAERGLNVRVLTCMPHYPAEIADFEAWYHAVEQNAHNVIEINRLATPRHAVSAPFRRIQSGVRFLVLGSLAVLTGSVRRAPVVVSLCPSILTVVLANLCMRRGGRHVAIVHDIESGIAKGLGIVGETLTRVLRWVECVALSRCSLVIVLTEAMRRQLERAGIGSPIEVLPVWADTDSIRPTPNRAGRAQTLLYSGNLGRKQGLSQLLDLAEDLRTRRSDLRMIIRGAGNQAQAVASEAACRGLDNIEFHELVPHDGLCESLGQGDIHLVPQHPNAADFALPSKIFSIMAAARPFVATAAENSPLWHLQRESKAFVCVPPNDRTAFADAVLALAHDAVLRQAMGARGRDYVMENYSKRKCLDRLVSAVVNPA